MPAMGGASLQTCYSTAVIKRRHGRTRRRSLLRADVPAVVRHGRACPHKAGHDGDGAVRRLRSSLHLHSAHETAVVNVVMAARGDEALLRADVPAIHVLLRS